MTGSGRVEPIVPGLRQATPTQVPGQPATLDGPAGGDGRDSRVALSYLLYGEVDDYIALMDVLEASVTELSPAEVARAVSDAGHRLPDDVVEDRLERLRQWGAAHATTDTSRILRHSDLLARNWRYTATAVGRQVHRFYRTVLAGTPAVREIPLAGLNRVVRSLEALRDGTAEDEAAPSHLSTRRGLEPRPPKPSTLR